RPQREPCNARTSTYGDGHACSGTTHPSDERRRIDRAHPSWSRHPAPTCSNISPASIVEGRETPSSIVDPCPAPSSNPEPAPVGIGGPACSADGGRPHRAIVRCVLPAAVLCEIVSARYLGRYVLARLRLRALKSMFTVDGP